jgi:hypothetical protein
MLFMKVNFLLFSAPKQRLDVIDGSFGQYTLVYTIKCRFLNYLGNLHRYISNSMLLVLYEKYLIAILI